MTATANQAFYLENLIGMLNASEAAELNVAAVKVVGDDGIICIMRTEASRLIGKLVAFLNSADCHLSDPRLARR
jgi:hypothetical protein